MWSSAPVLVARATNHATASLSPALRASCNHWPGSIGSAVASSALRLRFAPHHVGAPTWFRRFWGVSPGGSACAMYLVSHRGDGGCCGVGSAYFRLSVWTDCIMRNWNTPTSVRSLCRSAVGMASTRDSGMSSLTHSHSSWLSAACSHWCVYGVQSVQLLRHRSQKSLQAGQ